jgi:hypothetical protein
MHDIMLLVCHELSQLNADLREVVGSFAFQESHRLVTQMQRIKVRLESFFSIAKAENFFLPQHLKQTYELDKSHINPNPLRRALTKKD